MYFYISFAFKNILRDRKRSLTLGVNYLIVSLILLLLFSITSGLKKNIYTNVISSTAGHITIAGEYIVNGRTFIGIKNYQQIRDCVMDNFTDATVFTRYGLSSTVYNKNISKRLSFIGIDVGNDTTLLGQISMYDGSWQDFILDTNGIILPKTLAEYFELKRRDDVLISTRSRFGAFNTGIVHIKGLFTSSNYFLQEQVIAHFKFLQTLDLADASIASKMFIFFPTLSGIEQKRTRLLSLLSQEGFVANKPASNEDALNAVSAASPRYTVLDENINQIRLTVATADEVTGIVSQVVQAINSSGLFVAGIMLFIISVSLFINIRMSITERMQEIGTLRAIGAAKTEVIGIFILEYLILSILCSIIGIFIGLILIEILSTLVTFPADGVFGLALYNGHIVLQPTYGAIAFILFIMTFFTMLFAFFPARYIGKIPAAVALQKKAL